MAATDLNVTPEASEAGRPPNGNTGGKLESAAKLDWLRVRISSNYVDTVVAWLGELLGDATSVPDRGAWGYRSKYQFDCGAFLVFTEGRWDACVDLPGKACDLLGAAKLLELIKLLSTLGGVGRRLDAAFDDFDGLIPMDVVHEAGHLGNFAGFRTYRKQQQFSFGKLTGDTAYFGVRGSDGSGKFVRFYNKGMESGGVTNSIRLEVEHSDDCAHLLFCDLAACDTVEQFTRVIAAACGGAMSFLQRVPGVAHLDKLEVASWWRRLLDVLGKCVYRPERRKTKLQETVEWVERQVARPLAMVRAAVDEMCGKGRDFLLALVDAGELLCMPAKLVGRSDELSPSYVRGVLSSLRIGGGGGPRAKLAAAADGVTFASVPW